MIISIEGCPFTHICGIQPEREANGTLKEFYPHLEFQTDLALLPYGEGPFCKFRIPDDIPNAGVYVLTIDHDRVYYVGKTVNLSQRYNVRGCGSIYDAPRK